MKTQMKIFRKTIPFLLAGLLVISLINCKGNKQEGNTEGSAVESALDKEEIEQKVRDVVYPLPTAFEVTEMINKIEASFIIGLTNPTSNVDKYFTDKDQALNLGIYSADLSYASTYQIKQEVMNFMDASQLLIMELDITGAFSKEFIDEVEANINNKDLLIDLITNSFYDTYEYLVKSKKEDLSLLVVTGSWIEALYISCNISETVYDNPEFVNIILHQKTSLNKLIDLLTPHNEHETIKSLLNDLKPIKEVYDSVDETGITVEQLDQIKSKISDLRNQIVA